MNWIKGISLVLTAAAFVKKYGWVKFRDTAEDALKTAGESLETIVSGSDDSNKL